MNYSIVFALLLSLNCLSTPTQAHEPLLSVRRALPFIGAPYFSCQSEGWQPSGSLDKIMFVSDCSRVPLRLLRSFQKTAQKICSAWANKRALESNYQTLFYDSAEACNNVVDKDLKFNLEINRTNKVQYLSSQEKNTGKTTAYLNQHFGEQAIINPDQTEQAQWIQAGETTYCGFVRDDIGFSANLGLLEVIRFSSQERALYQYTEEGLYKLYLPSENIQAPYLIFNYPKSGQATVEFFELTDNTRKPLKTFAITYKDWHDMVTPSECY